LRKRVRRNLPPRVNFLNLPPRPRELAPGPPGGMMRGCACVGLAIAESIEGLIRGVSRRAG